MTSTDPQDSNGATPNSVNGSEGRISSGYSINGILGIQHANEINVNSMKRKRVDEHGEFEGFIYVKKMKFDEFKRNLRLIQYKILKFSRKY